MSRICMWDVVQVKGFTNAMVIHSVPDDYCVVIDKNLIVYKVKYEDVTVVEYKKLISDKDRKEMIDNLIKERLEEIFNKAYPKEIRCNSNLFEGGLFKKGFIEGYKKCEEDNSKKI